jgi:hypothetical protein
MRRLLVLLSVMLALAVSALAAEAQTPVSAIELRITKVNGFNLGGQIEGRFRLTASGPVDLQRVTFLIDGTPIGEIATSPFGMTFDTGSYRTGRHVLSAVGEIPSGLMLESNLLAVEFVSPETARTSMLQIIVPIVAIVAVASVVAIVGPLLVGRDRHRRHDGEYGLAGGAVCKRCGLPFSRHLITLRLFGMRLERCPHCGKWMMASRASPQQLSEAEARLTDQTPRTPAPTEDEDSLRRMIDDSRFEE